VLPVFFFFNCNELQLFILVLVLFLFFFMFMFVSSVFPLVSLSSVKIVVHIQAWFVSRCCFCFWNKCGSLNPLLPSVFLPPLSINRMAWQIQTARTRMHCTLFALPVSLLFSMLAVSRCEPEPTAATSTLFRSSSDSCRST